MKLSELDFYLNDFLAYCTQKGLSKRTVSSYEQSLRLFVAYLKNEHNVDGVEEVRTGHIRHYISYVQERGKYTVVSRQESSNVNFPHNRKDYKKAVSAVTINNYIRNIKVFFNWLELEGDIRKNPVDKITQIKTIRKQKRGISEQEFRVLLEQFDYTKYHGYRNKVIVMILQDTGMRISECLNINLDDIDFHHRMILLTKTKGKAERYVYFSHVMARELKFYLKHRDRYIVDSSLLFPTTRGTKIAIQSFEKQLKDAGRRMGLDVHPHQLRNNFARQYLLNGGDFFTLSRILGHSSVKVTEEAYMDLTREEIAKKYSNHSPLGNWRLK